MKYNLNLYCVCGACGLENLVARDNLDTFVVTCIMCGEVFSVMIPFELKVVIRDANTLAAGRVRDVHIEQ